MEPGKLRILDPTRNANLEHRIPGRPSTLPSTLLPRANASGAMNLVAKAFWVER